MTRPYTVCFKCYAHHPDLHSFPTRRSSDLTDWSQPWIKTSATRSKGRLSDPESFLKRISRNSSGALTTFCARVPSRRKDRKSTRLNSSHMSISYAVFCLKKKKTNYQMTMSH